MAGSTSAHGMDPPARRATGRVAARLYAAAGVLTIVNNFIPPFDHLNRPVLFLIGTSALGFGAAALLSPWERWPPWSTRILAPLAIVHIAAANLFGGVSPYSYAVYFVVVFVFAGMTHPPGTSLRLAPVAAAGYVVPALMQPDVPAIASLSATVVVPVCVIVGEVLARRTADLQAARERADRQSALLTSIAKASRTLHSLEPDRVLETVVATTLDMGFEAAEICMFDEEAGTWRSRLPVGLPDAYAGDGVPIGDGLAGRVWTERTMVVVNDYSSLPGAIPAVQEQGFRVVIAAPIWCRGRLEAALIAGTRQRPVLRDEDVEAFELLAEQAGRALENAHRFEHELETVRKLAELDTLKSDFISNVSHELRTPLAVIYGLSDTLTEHWTELEDTLKRNLLGRMHSNAEVLDGIITNLLDFARLEAGRVQVRPEDVDVGALVRSAAGRLEGLFEDHALRVSAPDGLIVRADPQLLERIVENLLSNAARHTPHGTTVVLEAVRDRDRAVVSVADDGPGIPPEELAHIGERFFRGGSPDRRSTRGTGLGLAFVAELLSLHGSRLEVQSTPGRGARFSFALPVASRATIPSATREPVRAVVTADRR